MIDLYKEWMKFVKHLGQCVSIGFKDLEIKSNSLKDNRLLMTEYLGLVDMYSPEYSFVMRFARREKQLGVHNFNGLNL